MSDLESKSVDMMLSTVKRHTAKAQLEQVKQEDPLPLRKAKIGQEVGRRSTVLAASLHHASHGV